MSTAPVTVLLCGKSAEHREIVKSTVQPTFEVIRESGDIEGVRAAINDYFVKDNAPAKKPQLIIMGGAFSQSDFESCTSLTPLVHPGKSESQVAWMRPSFQKPGHVGGPPPHPPAEVLINSIRTACMGNLESFQSGKAKGEIVYFDVQ